MMNSNDSFWVGLHTLGYTWGQSSHVVLPTLSAARSDDEAANGFRFTQHHSPRCELHFRLLTLFPVVPTLLAPLSSGFGLCLSALCLLTCSPVLRVWGTGFFTAASPPRCAVLLITCFSLGTPSLLPQLGSSGCPSLRRISSPP